MNRERLMKHLQPWLLLALSLVLLAVAGCGGGSDAPPLVNSGASATVTVVPVGNGVFTLQGTNLAGISGIQLDLNYDNTVMAAPVVTQGSFIANALLAANTAVPGAIRIGIVSTTPISGSGPLASVAFATVRGEGALTVSSLQLIDQNGAQIR
jgi:hypothetical protein